MEIPHVYVDFNEMPSGDEVLLSQSDSKIDSTGQVVHLKEGMYLAVYSEDLGDNGQVDNLIAEGYVATNSHGGWTTAAKWLLRISGRGIRHESEDAKLGAA